MILTFDRLALEVIRLAEERPDYIYPANGVGGCTYVDESEERGYASPPCLWGQAMLNLGVSHAALFGESGFIREALPRVGIDATPAQLNWAMKVQGQQDSRRPWGEALASAGKCPFTDV
jgi:hypothetical protein